VDDAHRRHTAARDREPRELTLDHPGPRRARAAPPRTLRASAAVRQRTGLVDLGEQFVHAGEEPLTPIVLGAAAESEDRTQNASVNGEAKIETAASSACVSASIPVSAVISFGIVSVRCGSTIAMSGPASNRPA
jgi:hypothetical protein